MHKYHTSKEYFWEDMQGKLTSVVALGGKRADRDLSLYKLYSTTIICNFPKSLCISHFFAIAHILPISSSSSSRVNSHLLHEAVPESQCPRRDYFLWRTPLCLRMTAPATFIFSCCCFLSSRLTFFCGQGQ